MREHNFWWALLYAITAGFLSFFVLEGFGHEPRMWPLVIAVIVFFATFRRR